MSDAEGVLRHAEKDCSTSRCAGSLTQTPSVA